MQCFSSSEYAYSLHMASWESILDMTDQAHTVSPCNCFVFFGFSRPSFIHLPSQSLARSTAPNPVTLATMHVRYPSTPAPSTVLVQEAYLDALLQHPAPFLSHAPSIASKFFSCAWVVARRCSWIPRSTYMADAASRAQEKLLPFLLPSVSIRLRCPFAAAKETSPAASSLSFLASSLLFSHARSVLPPPASRSPTPSSSAPCSFDDGACVLRVDCDAARKRRRRRRLVLV